MNDELRELLQTITIKIQSGKWGVPTMDMLETCGEIHAMMEKL